MDTDETCKIDLSINNLMIQAVFYKDNIDHIFIPILERWSSIQRRKNRRIIIYCAAAPGTGKSTLVSFLEKLSKNNKNLTPIQAIGIDGFHYASDYLSSHHIDDDMNKPLLQTIKGAPNTFNVPKLTAYIKKLSCEKEVEWPTYSRVIHDVADETVLITENIVILEGNYLLLKDSPWANLVSFADQTMFIYSDKSSLKNHLIHRKQFSGSTFDESIEHYNIIDSQNIDTVSNNSLPADIMLYVDNKMKYYLISK